MPFLIKALQTTNPTNWNRFHHKRHWNWLYTQNGESWFIRSVRKSWKCTVRIIFSLVIQEQICKFWRNSVWHFWVSWTSVYQMLRGLFNVVVELGAHPNSHLQQIRWEYARVIEERMCIKLSIMFGKILCTVINLFKKMNFYQIFPLQRKDVKFRSGQNKWWIKNRMFWKLIRWVQKMGSAIESFTKSMI